MSESVRKTAGRIRQTPYFSKSDELRARGFESGSTVYAADPTFTTEDMAAAVFTTKRSTPRTLPIQIDDAAIVDVVVSMVRPVFSRDITIQEDLDYAHRCEGAPAQKAPYNENPDWYIEGWVVDPQAHDGTQPLRVRAYVFSVNPLAEARPSIIEAQIIPQNPDPFGRVGYVNAWVFPAS